jgi:hypothetical protein
MARADLSADAFAAAQVAGFDMPIDEAMDRAVQRANALLEG